ncbi:hypothetical protein ACIBP6_38665 [Nonomuraea terrae]|uniref:hypothetical protein n=1 Tax=Nonomuraea terrae TaxID=2530383 RepID=UPI0037A7F8F1
MTITADPEPGELSVDKTVDRATARVGTTVTYRIQVTNDDDHRRRHLGRRHGHHHDRDHRQAPLP